MAKRGHKDENWCRNLPAQKGMNENDGIYRSLTGNWALSS
jgi:hypothetical protein